MSRSSDQPVLTDGVVTLRPWRPDDAESVFHACQDPDIQRWTQVPVPYRMEDAVSFVSEIAPAAWREGMGAVFAAVDGADVVVGSAGLVALDRSAGSTEIGYWVAPEARFRGVATAAAALLARWSSESLGLERIELFTDPANVASQAVAARAGFRQDGEAEHTFRDGQVRMLRHVYLPRAEP